MDLERPQWMKEIEVTDDVNDFDESRSAAEKGTEHISFLCLGK
jgi:hypothetical protein